MSSPSISAVPLSPSPSPPHDSHSDQPLIISATIAFPSLTVQGECSRDDELVATSYTVIEALLTQFNATHQPTTPITYSNFVGNIDFHPGLHHHSDYCNKTFRELLPPDGSQLALLVTPSEGHMRVLEEQKENLRAHVGQLELVLQDYAEKESLAAGSRRKPLKGKKAAPQSQPLSASPGPVSSDYSSIVTEVTRQVTAALNSRISSLEAEVEALKVDNEALKVDNEALKVDNEALKGDNGALRLDLQKERRERKDDFEALRQVTCLLTPLHLRVLLDLTRQKILHVLSYDSWEDLRNNRNIHELTHYILQGITHVSNCPTHETILFLCSYNNVRREGNIAAHEAEQEDVREAVLRKPVDSKDRRCLEELYTYTYDSKP